MIHKTGQYHLSAGMVTRTFLLYLPVLSTIILGLFLQDEVYAMENIRELEWQNRIILVRSDASAEDYAALLTHADNEIRDRHIYWFVFSGDQVTSNYPGHLSQNFIEETKKYFRDDSNHVLLIGKDGGIKDRSSRMDLRKLFALIDTMPMRQAEMGD
jgi:hypothetical protein